jgi:hypothetical protein
VDGRVVSSDVVRARVFVGSLLDVFISRSVLKD